MTFAEEMYKLAMENKEELEEGLKIENWTQERIKTITIDWRRNK